MATRWQQLSQLRHPWTFLSFRGCLKRTATLLGKCFQGSTIEIFDIAKMTRDQNLEDRTVGQMLLLFSQQATTKRTLEEYLLVFTGAGSIHKKRPNMARHFFLITMDFMRMVQSTTT